MHQCKQSNNVTHQSDNSVHNQYVYNMKLYLQIKMSFSSCKSLSVYRPKAVPLSKVWCLFLHQIQLRASPAEETRCDSPNAAPQRCPRQEGRRGGVARERRSKPKHIQTLETNLKHLDVFKSHLRFALANYVLTWSAVLFVAYFVLLGFNFICWFVLCFKSTCVLPVCFSEGSSFVKLFK